jgi:hypothetical protein
LLSVQPMICYDGNANFTNTATACPVLRCRPL